MADKGMDADAIDPFEEARRQVDLFKRTLDVLTGAAVEEAEGNS